MKMRAKGGIGTGIGIGLGTSDLVLPIHIGIVLELGMGAHDLATDPALILYTAPAIRVELDRPLIKGRQLALHIVER